MAKEVLKDAKLCFLHCEKCDGQMADTGFKNEQDPSRAALKMYICQPCSTVHTSEKTYPFVSEIEGNVLSSPPEAA